MVAALVRAKRGGLLRTLGPTVVLAAIVAFSGAATTAAAPTPTPTPAPTISKQPFGSVGGQPVDLYTLTNPHGAQLKVITYDATIQSLMVRDRDGNLSNVVLGFPNLQGYVNNSPAFGGVIGRYAGRIANGTFTLDGKTYHVPAANGLDARNTGTIAFDKRVWQATEVRQGDNVGVKLGVTSPSGEDGFPGTLHVDVTYTLTSHNEVSIEYHATTDAPTVINLTNATYFNLAGENSGTVGRHILEIFADRYAPVNASLVPTGATAIVAGTPFNFTEPIGIGERLRFGFPQMVLAHGYDATYVLNRPKPNDQSLIHAAVAHDPQTGRTVDVYTTEPTIQFESGNFLDGSLVGTSGKTYRQSDGFALETEHFPDSPNHPNFPSTVLRPGQTFTSTTVYAFSI